MPAKNKRPKAAGSPKGFAAGKIPRTAPHSPTDTWNSLPVFSFRYADRQDREAWAWPKGDELDTLFEFLCSISLNTWKEIRSQVGGGDRNGQHKLHHSQSFDSVSPLAQRLIAEMRHDELFEELFRFRLGSAIRLWGYEREGTFYILWWDPNHLVNPLDRN